MAINASCLFSAELYNGAMWPIIPKLAGLKINQSIMCVIEDIKDIKGKSQLTESQKIKFTDNFKKNHIRAGSGPLFYKNEDFKTQYKIEYLAFDGESDVEKVLLEMKSLNQKISADKNQDGWRHSVFGNENTSRHVCGYMNMIIIVDYYGGDANDKSDDIVMNFIRSLKDA